MAIKILKNLRSKSENVDLAFAIIDDVFNKEYAFKNIRNYIETLNR